jgi:hypothetical protein
MYCLCVNVYWPLGDNPIAVNKYIISHTLNLGTGCEVNDQLHGPAVCLPQKKVCTANTMKLTQPRLSFCILFGNGGMAKYVLPAFVPDKRKYRWHNGSSSTQGSVQGWVHTCNVTAYRKTVSWHCERDSSQRIVSKVAYAVTLRACSVCCRYLAVASKG